MSTVLRKITIVPFFLMIALLLLTAWLFPALGGVIGIVLLVAGFLVNVLTLVKRHRAEYLQGKISRAVYMRKVFVETLGILLAMVLSVLIAARVVDVATRHIVDMIARFVVEILIAFLVGISVGFVFKKLWDRVQQRYTREPHT